MNRRRIIPPSFSSARREWLLGRAAGAGPGVGPYTGIIPDDASVVSHVFILNGAFVELKGVAWTVPGGLTFNPSAPTGFPGGSSVESLTGINAGRRISAAAILNFATGGFVITAVMKPDTTNDQVVFAVGDTVGNPQLADWLDRFSSGQSSVEYNTFSPVISGPTLGTSTRVLSIGINTVTRQVRSKMDNTASFTGSYPLNPTNASATMYIGDRPAAFGVPFTGNFMEMTIRTNADPASEAVLASINTSTLNHP